MRREATQQSTGQEGQHNACGKDEGYVPLYSFDDLPLAFWTSIVGAAYAMVDRNDNDDNCAS